MISVGHWRDASAVPHHPVGMRLGREIFVAVVSGFVVALITVLAGSHVVQGLAYGLGVTLLVGLAFLGLRSGPVQSRLPHVSIARRRGPPHVDINVTAGSSPEVRINVTNRGPQAQFHATAMEVANRNDPNQIRAGLYAVAWLGHTSNLITLLPQQSHALVVARFQILEFPNPAPMTRMGQADIMEWDGAKVSLWDTFRWIFEPNGKLAEYDLDVKLFSTVSSEPLLLKYTLRPAAWVGPLELMTRK